MRTTRIKKNSILIYTIILSLILILTVIQAVKLGG